MLVEVQPRGRIVKFHRKSVFPNKTNASRSTLSMAEVKYSPRAVLVSSLVEAQKIPPVEKPLALISLVISPVAMTNTPFTPAKHVLLNWFSLNENYKQSTEKLDFPLDSSTC